jgi:predicted nucleic acid-binding protein
VSYCLDTNFLVSRLFPDAHTARAFAWLERLPQAIYISDWVATELYALVRRRMRAGHLDAEVADAALLEFEAFAGRRAQRLWQSASRERLPRSLHATWR